MKKNLIAITTLGIVFLFSFSHLETITGWVKFGAGDISSMEPAQNTALTKPQDANIALEEVLSYRQETGLERERDLAQIEGTSEEELDTYKDAVEDVFEEFMQETEDTYAFYREQVEAIWNEYRESTKKTWVDYSEDISALNEIDFEDGFVNLEAVIPVTDDNPQAVEQKIVERLVNTLSEENIAGMSPLEGQLAFPKTGKIVKASEADRYFQEEIKDRLKKERLDSQDGVTRYQYTIKLHLIPNHLQVRAKMYLPEVVEYSDMYGLEPALVLAVIHTESWFNPLAVSKAGACGLMQLIPAYGGKDSYQFIFSTSRAPSKEFLFVPKNNIKLGTAYIHLLQTKYLQYKGNDEKGKILTLCAYNWGPGSVNRKIIGANRIEDMSTGELKRIINQRAPEETSNYFVKILEREKTYDKMFD